MRTTLTLDGDVAAKIRAEMRKTGRSMKETVNDLLRVALNRPKRLSGAKPFLVAARPLGQRVDVDFDCVAELLDQIEGPWHK